MLTKYQQSVLNAMMTWAKNFNYAASTRDIWNYYEYSIESLRIQLKILEKLGYIRKNGMGSKITYTLLKTV